MDRVIELLKQYRYGILILALGIFMMLLPAPGTEDQKQTLTPDPELLTMEEKLEQILSRMDGVGKTSILLTVALGEQTLYEYNEDNAANADSQSFHVEPVILTDENRAEQGMVRQRISPVYRGAIVVCQGGDSPAVRLSVTEAVSDVTGLTADKISVRKMK